MFSILFKQQISFDLLLKFNIKHADLVPAFESASFSSNDCQLGEVPLRLIPAFYLGTLPNSSFGVFTKIKKANSNFKTRTGDLHGLKNTIRGSQGLDFLYDFFSIFSPELSAIGLKPNFNVNSFGGLNFSLPDAKLHSFFSDLEVPYISFLLGASFSINFKPKLLAKQTLVCVSSFIHLPIVE
jgi:hypothetical protein